jgi:dTDP-4-dehydrorhamnose reductase
MAAEKTMAMAPAIRPANSVLSCKRFEESFCRLPAWDQALTLWLEK